jgi:uncharacterized protein YraI
MGESIEEIGEHIRIYGCLPEGKTLIGTCGDCKWWKQYDSIDKDRGVCECQANFYASYSIGDENRYHHFDKTFGCNHWKLKGGE